MLSRGTPSSSMQKTYDDCYLICSTAVYFEKQSNEEEALRSWRSALDAIYYHNAYRIPANYKPKSETERALQDSLRDMELQCKERVDLLEALRKSRDEAADPLDPLNPAANSATASASSSSSVLAQGTVAPVNYPDIARPPLPQRPAVQPRLSTPGSSTRSVDPIRSKSSSHVSAPARNSPSPALEVPQKKVSRTPSPDKKPGLLRSTLRSSGAAPAKNGGAGKFSVSTLRPRAPAPASQAATLAWPGAPPAAGAARPLSAVNPAQQPVMSRHSLGPIGNQPLSPIDPPSSLGNGPKSPKASTQKFFGKKSRDSGGGARLTSTPQPSLQPSVMPPPPPPHREPVSAAPSTDRLAQTGAAAAPLPPSNFPAYRREYASSSTTVDSKAAQRMAANLHGNLTLQQKNSSAPPSRSRTPERKKKTPPPVPRKAIGSPSSRRADVGHRRISSSNATSTDLDSEAEPQRAAHALEETESYSTGDAADAEEATTNGGDAAWDARVKQLMKNLPKGVDEQAAKAIFNEVVIQGDEVHWDDVAGLDIAKSALKEAVVYPFLRPDLFRGLREPARGMLLFGPPGTGKTMLARAVATESRSTFFAISASSLTSKYLGESEKLVRALFSIAKVLTPSIIFVDEIDSLLSARSGSGEHEATRRIKTEFLIQWSDLAKAAAGRDDKDKSAGDASRVLVLAATNLPWAIDEAARRRFVRRQYIPLPEAEVRGSQLQRLLGAQKTSLDSKDIAALVQLTDGYSGSDITALAKDAAMGPLRSLGEKLLHMTPEDIRPISMDDFEASLVNIRPSVSSEGLQEYEDWARQFGERGG